MNPIVRRVLALAVTALLLQTAAPAGAQMPQDSCMATKPDTPTGKTSCTFKVSVGGAGHIDAIGGWDLYIKRGKKVTYLQSTAAEPPTNLDYAFKKGDVITAAVTHIGSAITVFVP
jgi:hypothetical protein